MPNLILEALQLIACVEENLLIIIIHRIEDTRLLPDVPSGVDVQHFGLSLHITE